jgi:hypothetical protein
VTHRVVDHPVLGPAPARARVTVLFAGEPLEALEGEPIAAALAAAGVRVFRKTSKRGEPRQLFCGIGRCTDCVMVVDGQPNVRTCVTPVRDGMKVEVQDGRGVWERRRGDSAASRPSGVSPEEWTAERAEETTA